MQYVSSLANSASTATYELKNLTKINIAILALLVFTLLMLLISWSSTNKSINSIKKLFTDRKVLVTGSGDKNSKTDGVNTIIVTLYSASWCPNCVMFEPKWKSLNEKINEAGSDIANKIKLIKQDCTDPENEGKILSLVKLKDGKKFPGYPTVTIKRQDDNEEEMFMSNSDSVEKIIEKIKAKAEIFK